MNRLLNAAMVFALGFAVFFLAAGNASASNESVSFDAQISPQSHLYSSLERPFNLEIQASVTAPASSDKVGPLKSLAVSLPADLHLNPSNLTPCTTFSDGSIYYGVYPGGDESMVRSICPNAQLGSGVGAWYTSGINNSSGPDVESVKLLLFYGGTTPSGGIKIEIVGLGPGFTTYAFSGIWKEGALTFHIHTDLGYPAWGDMDIEIPGPEGLDPNFVTGTCSTGSWSSDATFTLGSTEGGPDSSIGPVSDVDACPTLDNPNLGLSVKSVGEGSGEITSSPAGINCGSSCNATFPVDTSVVLSASPNSKSVFSGWSGPCVAQGKSCVLTMGSTRSVVAHFDVKAPSGPVGVSINNGAQFTNSPNVSLYVVWNQGERTATVSNDGGFRSSGTFDLKPKINWKLDSSGPERLPKTVYLRFGQGQQSFTDDIILDETAPRLGSVSASKVGASSSSTRSLASASGRHNRGRHNNGRRKVKLRIKASDKTSGVARIQVGRKKSRKLKKIKYRKRVKVRASGKRLWVRVLDRAGNASKWKRVKIKRVRSRRH